VLVAVVREVEPPVVIVEIVVVGLPVDVTVEVTVEVVCDDVLVLLWLEVVVVPPEEESASMTVSSL
jgi:hypothetical protein